MKIFLTRYYGDERTTRSLMRVLSEEGEELLACEGREPRFADYEEAFPGCSRCCLATGVYRCKVVSTELSPMTLTVIKSPGHRCCRIGWDEVAQVRQNMVLVGESDGYELPEWREIIRQRQTFERLTALVYKAYCREEEIEIIIH